MLNAINRAFEALLRERGLIDPQDVDVRFDMPSDEWIDSLTKPTVNAFLVELHENVEKRDGAPITIKKDGRAERRMAPRRIDLVYMVSVLTADVEDENELLWRVLETLMKFQQFPPDVLPESLRSVTPPLVTRLAGKDEVRNSLDLWSALGAEPRPTISYIVTAPMDLGLEIQAPLVLTRTARYRRMGSEREPPYDDRNHVGGYVRTRAGEPLPDVRVSRSGSARDSVTNAEGQFLLRGVPPGATTLKAEKPGWKPKTLEVEVPAASYDIELDR